MRRLSLSSLLRLALRQLWRERRAAELRTLLIALLIAVAASSSIGYLSQRLNDAMLLRASEFLAADLVLDSSLPATQAQRDSAVRLGLRQAQSVEFASVLIGEEAVQLASVKAVDNPYPLRGELKSAASPFAEEQPGDGPLPGEAWAEPRLLLALGLAVGDSVELGQHRLRISRVLTHEPDRSSDFYSLTPRLLMHLDDLAATQIIQPGSRVRYRLLWQGNPEQLAALRDSLKGQLLPQQRLLDARDGNSKVGKALQRAERYLNLSSLAAVLLAGVAVALSANRYARRRFDASALLRCLGLSARETLYLYGMQLAVLGLLASLLGALLGWFGHLLLLHLLAGLLPAELPAAGVQPLLAGVATGLVALAGFALPPLAALGRVPPLRVLRSDLQPLAMRAVLVYACALLALGLIMWRLSLDLALTLSLLGGGLLACLLLGGLLLLGLRSLRRLLHKASLAWRLGLGQLLRQPLAAAGQMLAFGLILLVMALVALLRGELLDTWQAQLPERTANHFALNIQPAERQAWANALQQLKAESSPLYPMLPGRLVAINQQPVAHQVEADSRGERATRRDLNLTWSAELPSGNQITAGSWWDEADTQGLGVSLEAELASSLGIALGDQLTFNLAGREITRQVSSLRTVDWDSFQPNFFVIFDPRGMQQHSASYITSFYLPSAQADQLLPLARQFPGVTLLPIEAILDQLRSILAQVSLAVEFVLLFVLAAGLAVVLAGLQATLDERTRQSALLRALGAERRLLLQARRREFALLGGLSGLLAALGCELVSALLYTQVLDLHWQPHPWLLLLPLLGAALIASVGVLATRETLKATPLSVLRGQ